VLSLALVLHLPVGAHELEKGGFSLGGHQTSSSLAGFFGPRGDRRENVGALPTLLGPGEFGFRLGLSVEPPQPDTVWHAVNCQG
jgi:hypothetical protein